MVWTQDLAEAIELEEKAQDELRALRKRYGNSGLGVDDVASGPSWEDEHTGLRSKCSLEVCVDYPPGQIGDLMGCMDRLGVRYEMRAFKRRYAWDVEMTDMHVGHTSFIFDTDGNLTKLV